MKKVSLNYYIYIVLVLLIIYQDSPFGLVAGAFGYSFLPILSILLCGIYIVINNGKLKINMYIRKLMYLYIYLCIISVIALVIWVIQGNSSVILGEDIVIKSVKVLIYFLSYILFLIVVYNITENITEEQFLKPIVFVLLLITIICIIETFNMPNAFSFLHFNGRKTYTRIRLLSKESSWTTMTIYVYGLLSLYYSVVIKKRKSILVLVVSCLLVLITLTSSKTLMISIFISIIIALVLNFKRLERKTLIRAGLIILIGILSCIILSRKLMLAIVSSLRWSSIPTRIYTILIGIIIGLRYPFGTGTAVYLKIFPGYLSKYYYLLDKYDKGHALKEINQYINAISDQSVTVKSGLLQYNMYWGILGTIFFLFILYNFVYKRLNLVKQDGLLLIKMGLIMVTILLLFAADFTFEFWLFISFILFKTKSYCNRSG